MRRIAVIGATGAVGQELQAVLRERTSFREAEYELFASPASAGKSIDWLGRPQQLKPLSSRAFAEAQLVFFAAGTDVSREFAPQALRAGATVIDKSSAFRMDPAVPLVVPEINGHLLDARPRLIANPNCTSIVLTMAIAPLHRLVPLQRVVVATYQAVSGAGARAVDELRAATRAELAGEPFEPEVFTEPCAFNVFSHDTPIGADGYNGEEQKVIAESRKILDAPRLEVAPTCMRVPVLRSHTEVVNLEFTAPIDLEKARAALTGAAGVEVLDDRANNRFPTPRKANGRDAILVGRIRLDPTIPDRRGLQLICVGDQLRKGAALNAVQIAERLENIR